MEADEKGSGYIPSKLKLCSFPPTVIFKSHLLPHTVHVLKMFIYFVLHLLAWLLLTNQESLGLHYCLSLEEQ